MAYLFHELVRANAESLGLFGEIVDLPVSLNQLIQVHGDLLLQIPDLVQNQFRLIHEVRVVILVQHFDRLSELRKAIFLFEFELSDRVRAL